MSCSLVKSTDCRTKQVADCFYPRVRAEQEQKWTCYLHPKHAGGWIHGGFMFWIGLLSFEMCIIFCIEDFMDFRILPSLMWRLDLEGPDRQWHQGKRSSVPICQHKTSDISQLEFLQIEHDSRIVDRCAWTPFKSKDRGRNVSIWISRGKVSFCWRRLALYIWCWNWCKAWEYEGIMVSKLDISLALATVSSNLAPRSNFEAHTSSPVSKTINTWIEDDWSKKNWMSESWCIVVYFRVQ